MYFQRKKYKQKTNSNKTKQIFEQKQTNKKTKQNENKTHKNFKEGMYFQGLVNRVLLAGAILELHPSCVQQK